MLIVDWGVAEVQTGAPTEPNFVPLQLVEAR